MGTCMANDWGYDGKIHDSYPNANQISIERYTYEPLTHIDILDL